MEPQFDAIQNMKTIESNYGPQVAREVVQIFLSDYPAKLAKLKDAIDQGNFEGLRFTAHDIKSGTLSMGIRPISSICEIIEREGASLGKEKLQTLFHQLETDYWRISKIYGEYLNLTH